eukprot:2770446-Ditylum_brightwellii.AAC.1
MEETATQSKLPSKPNSKAPKGTQAKWLIRKQKKVETQDHRELKLKKQPKTAKKKIKKTHFKVETLQKDQQA